MYCICTKFLNLTPDFIHIFNLLILAHHEEHCYFNASIAVGDGGSQC